MLFLALEARKGDIELAWGASPRLKPQRTQSPGGVTPCIVLGKFTIRIIRRMTSKDAATET
jgi:hypothetical protein